jgi:Uncharacterized small protein (DUF2158)
MAETTNQAPEFKPGDVVQLKSGGPELTVEGVTGECVGVQYFLASGELRRLKLQRECLRVPSSASGCQEQPAGTGIESRCPRCKFTKMVFNNDDPVLSGLCAGCWRAVKDHVKRWPAEASA